MESRTPIVCTLDAHAPCHAHWRSHAEPPPGVPLVVSRRRIELWAALWVVYLVWGSTYLGIKLAVRTLPPLLTAATPVPAAPPGRTPPPRCGGNPCRDPGDRAAIASRRPPRSARCGGSGRRPPRV